MSVLELGEDGAFDIDAVPDSDDEGDDATVEPPAASSGFVAARSFTGPKEGMSFRSGPCGVGYYPDESAAQHTYDKGYKRWEQFDAEDQGQASTEKAQFNTEAKVAEPVEEEVEIDTSLSMFETVPKEHHSSITGILRLTEAEVLLLNGEQADTVRSFRNMYKEQLAIKKNAAKNPTPTGLPEKKPQTAAERREESMARERKPFEQVHAEIEKMMTWPSFRDATSKWEALQSSKRAEEAALQAAANAERHRKVSEAYDSEVKKTAESSEKAARKLKKLSQNTGSTKKALQKKKDLNANLASIRKLAKKSAKGGFDDFFATDDAAAASPPLPPGPAAAVDDDLAPTVPLSA